MAGTYSGGLHDFGSGNLSVSFAKQSAILEKGKKNAAEAAKATGKAVVSADGKRLLAVAPRGYTSGPGARRVGAGPTAGPGRGSVGVAQTFGPGLGVVTTFRTTSPSLIPTGGPGKGAVIVGGVVGAGVGAAGAATKNYEYEIGKSTRTPIQIGGGWVDIDEGWSDAGDVEQRYGEGEFLSPAWFYGWGITINEAFRNLPRAVPQSTWDAAGAFRDEVNKSRRGPRTGGAGGW